jgi:hypothetical protein
VFAPRGREVLVRGVTARPPPLRDDLLDVRCKCVRIQLGCRLDRTQRDPVRTADGLEVRFANVEHNGGRRRDPRVSHELGLQEFPCTFGQRSGATNSDSEALSQPMLD